VLASGTGIQIRQAGGAAYHQRVIANVVAAAIPLQGGEAVHNLTLDYQPDWLAVAASELTPRLLAGQPRRRLPDGLARKLAAYPGWQGAERPGARVAPALLRTLDTAQP
jgi:hypothetical protein